MSDDSGTAGVAANTYGGPGFKYNPTPPVTRCSAGASSPRATSTSRYTNQGDRAPDHLGERQLAPDRLARPRAATSASTTSTASTRSSAGSAAAPTSATTASASRATTAPTSSSTPPTAARRRRGSSPIAVAVEDDARRAVHRSIFDRNGATGVQLPPGATTVTVRRRHAAPTRRPTRAHARRLRRAARRLPRPAVRHRRRALGPQQRVRRQLQDGVLSEARRLVGRFGRSRSSRTTSWLNQLRLRTAYGASGVQPGTIDAVQYFSATTARRESGDAPAVVFSTLGNRNLKPERSTELELGVDGTFWNNRLSTEITYYNKSSKDALISRVPAAVARHRRHGAPREPGRGHATRAGRR